MSLPVKFLSEAEGDLRDATQWYETERQGLGRKFKNAVFDGIDLVAKHPRSFAVERRGVRSAPVEGFPRYRVYYRVHRTHLEIVSVFHTSRDPEQWQRRN